MSTRRSEYYGRLGHVYYWGEVGYYYWDTPGKRSRIWVPDFIGKRHAFWRWLERSEHYLLSDVE